MIDDGVGFSLVPWRAALEQHVGRQISGTVVPGGGVDWSFDSAPLQASQGVNYFTLKGSQSVYDVV
jgi:hypothetical protein